MSTTIRNEFRNIMETVIICGDSGDCAELKLILELGREVYSKRCMTPTPDIDKLIEFLGEQHA